MAQRLYEAGFITYMRTDSTALSGDAVVMARDYIKTNFGDKYLPDNPISYSSREGAQEAHEAIRPQMSTCLRIPRSWTSWTVMRSVFTT